MTTPAEQASERAIIEAATDGPWCVDSYIVNPGDGGGHWFVYESYEDDGPLFTAHLGCTGDPEANARFAAAARTGWPKALDELDAERARAERAEARLAECERVSERRKELCLVTARERNAIRAIVRELREEITRLRAALERG
jgi:hypothetical protein